MVDVELTDNNGEKQRIQQKYQSINNRQEIEDKGMDIREKLTLNVEPGKYDAIIKITDTHSGSEGNFLLDMQLAATHSEQLDMSDITLAAKISPDKNTEDRWVKNGLKVIPNPSAVYSISLPMLYYYAEVYNLSYDTENQGFYRISSWVSDAAGDTIRQFPPRRVEKIGPTAILASGNNIVTLANGIYFLNLKVEDEANGQEVIGQKRLNFFKPGKKKIVKNKPLEEDEIILGGFYQEFSDSMLDLEFEQVAYIATDTEKKRYKNLNRDGKIRMLVNFWRSRDTDLLTAENEYRKEYFQRVEYANRAFSTKFRRGWKTDRGRVLLVYGIPSEIQRNPGGTMSEKPYEIWTYNEVENGVIFVFGDLRAFGDYELIHSTHSGEIFMQDWEGLFNPGADIFDEF